MKNNHINLFGIRIDNYSTDEVKEQLSTWLGSNNFHYIVTPNPEMIYDAQKDGYFKTVLNEADMSVADGFGIVLAAKILGMPLPNRISGSDLVWDIFKIANEKKLSVYLLGGKEDIAKITRGVVKDKYPAINIVGAESGGRLIFEKGKWDLSRGLLERINQAKPDILVIGRGHPWQEKFIDQHKELLPSLKMAIGVGGTFDFISGTIKRAPRFMRRLGLEWVWRLIQEPWRIGRIYKAVFKFLYLVIKNKFMFGRKKIKVRFAPSPTGFLHIGGLRTALYNWLFIKKNKGAFILRIEDTDQTRTVPGGEEDILKSLKWAGIEPDEGVYIDSAGKANQKGKNGPYRQSERLETYQKYAKQLINQGKAYYCFCTEQRLQQMREAQIHNKQAPRYDGTCRNLTNEEIQNKLDSKIPFVIRLKVPEKGSTEFKDEVYGKINIENKEIDDQVLIKSDGFPTYHLANVIDDHLMEITHVIRGEEWLPSTPKHILLYEAFGWKPPIFAHLPLLLNPDKSKLSKRQGEVAVKDYREAGYLPETINNFVALLGWNPKSDQEIYNMAELAELFDLSDVNKSGAVFNRKKLDWMNNHYIREKDPAELTDLTIPYLIKENIISDDEVEEKYDQIVKVILLLRERVNTLKEFTEQTGLFLKNVLKYNQELLIWKGADPAKVKEILTSLIPVLESFTADEFIAQNIEQKIKQWINDQGLDNGSVLWPFRVALSGEEKSPPPFDIAEIIGQEESISRVRRAISLL